MLSAFENQQSLVMDAVGGDRTALQTLLLLYYPQIETWVRSKFNAQLADNLEAEDLIQEVLVKVHRNIGSYREIEHGSFEAWLRTITGNCVVDAARRGARQKRGGNAQQLRAVPTSAAESLNTILDWVQCDSKLPERNTCREEARQAIHVCLSQLQPAQREAVVAYYFEHLNTNEVAVRMGRTPGAVRELLRRARERLRELMGTASTWLSRR